MRAFTIPALGLLLIGAGEPPRASLDNPAYSVPTEKWQTIDDAIDTANEAGLAVPEGVSMPEPIECRDTIEQTREASGQSPLLDREPATPDRPYAIYAVDRRQDDCSVMVMMGDRNDIRQLPAPADGDPRIPAQDGQ